MTCSDGFSLCTVLRKPSLKMELGSVGAAGAFGTFSFFGGGAFDSFGGLGSLGCFFAFGALFSSLGLSGNAVASSIMSGQLGTALSAGSRALISSVVVRGESKVRYM